MQDLAFDLVVAIRRTHTPSTASTSDRISSLLSLREMLGSTISSSHPRLSFNIVHERFRQKEIRCGCPIFGLTDEVGDRSFHFFFCHPILIIILPKVRGFWRYTTRAEPYAFLDRS